MPLKPPGTPTIDLTDLNDFGTLDAAVFQVGFIQPAGTGVFNTFVQIQHNGIEQGYNTDNSIAQFDEKNAHHQSLLLANIPIVIGDGTNGTVEGVAYRQFVLDINDPSGTKQYISLDELQIWQEESGSLTNFTNGAGFAGAHTNYLAYDLDAGGDHWIGLTDGMSHGSGQSDVSILIPDSFFINDTAHRYVTLYSAFGMQSGWTADGGFEEWGKTKASPAPGQTTAIAASKTATVPGGTADHTGEVITYDVNVYNVGDHKLTGITVNDPSVTDMTRVADIVGNNDSILDVGETWHFVAHHTVTQTDLDNNGDGSGTITNTATIDSNETSPVTASASVTVEHNTNVSLTKTASVPGGTADTAGEQISYTLDLTNDGVTTLTNPHVDDPMNAVFTPIIDPTAPILNHNVQFFVSITDGDFNLGDTNQNGVWDGSETFQFAYIGDSNANGMHDPGETWAAINLGDTNSDGIHQAGEVWVGDTNQNGVEDAGERWQFKNVGDTNHNHLQDPGETWQYANAGDIDLNGVQDAGETFTFANAGDTNQNGVQDAGETFQFANVGDTNRNGVEDPGETFQFSENDSVPGVDANNDGFNDGDTNHDGILNVGETWQYAFTHTVTQDEIDNGGVVDPTLAIHNTATGATDQASASASASIPVEQRPSFSIAKSADVASVDAAGDLIHYSVIVDNTGNMTLTGVTVADPFVTDLAFVSGDTDGDGKLDVNETWLYAGTHTVTQAEIDNGGVVDPALAIHNTATADTAQTAPQSASASVGVLQQPSFSIAKTADVASVDAAGDVIHYSVTVDNTGNMTLTGVTVTDPLVTDLALVSGDTDGDGKLDVNETWLYAGTHTVTQAEIDNGGVVDPALAIHNTATADTAQTAAQSASASVDVTQNPDLEILKHADVASVDAAGDVINYTVTVENTGNMTLTGLTVTDPLVTNFAYVSGDADNDGKLDLDETWTYTGTHTVTQDEIDSGGNILNTASADTAQTNPETASASVAVQQAPDLTITKASDVTSVAAAGDLINYTVTVDNAGNTTLTGVTVSDPFVTNFAYASGDLDSDGKLDVNETWTYTGSHTVTAAEIAAGADLVNTATADSDQTGPESASVTVDVPDVVAMTLDKSDQQGTHFVDQNENGVADTVGSGDLIQYIIVLHNAGTVALHDVAVTDTLINPLGAPSGDAGNDGILSPGESWVWDRNYFITDDDAAVLQGGGFVRNEADASAKDPANNIVMAHAVWDQFFPL